MEKSLLSSSTPAVTLNTLYNLGSSLYWNGLPVNTGTSSTITWLSTSSLGSLIVASSSYPWYNQQGIILSSSSPATTTNSLYNSSGTLYWNGLPINTSTSSAITWLSTSTLGTLTVASSSYPWYNQLGIIISSSSPSTTTNAIYNLGSTLYWNGQIINTASSSNFTNITITGTSTFATTTINGSTTISNNFTVTGTTTLSSTTISGILIVSGSSTLATTTISKLTVTGSTTLNSLTVLGLSTLATTTASGMTLTQNGLTLSSSTPASIVNTLYNLGSTLYWNGSALPTTSITSLNGLTTSVQTFATGSIGSDFNISSIGSTHTFNLPDASVSTRGVINTSAQSIAGTKTFSSNPILSLMSPGSVLFTTTGGLVSQDNSYLFYDATNHRLGLNNTSPGSTLDVKGTIRLSGSTSGYVGLSAQAAAGSTTYVLPASDGSSGQVLSTNGSGTLAWSSVSAGGTASIWTLRGGIPVASWQDVAYGNGLFVAVDSDVSHNDVMTSPDGVTWTQRSTPFDANWDGIAFGGGTFVAVAQTNSSIPLQTIMTSTDGITWTARTSPALHNWSSVTYGNNTFVAVSSDGMAMSSSDGGVTWTLRMTPFHTTWQSVAFGNNTFVGVASNGTIFSIMYSTDNGVNWTMASTVPTAGAWDSVVYGGNKFVAVSSSGTGNRVMTSLDGNTWTAGVSAADNNWQSVTYGNSTFVAVANTGTGNRVMTSTDGITWSTQTSAANYNWNSVIYGNGMFVAVGSSGTTDRVMTSGTFNSTSVALSDLGPSSAVNSIDNLNYQQTWNWSSLSSGSGLKLTSSSNALNSNSGVLSVANTGTSQNGVLSSFVASTTINSGLFVANSGKIGVNTSTPGAELEVKGAMRLSTSSGGFVGFTASSSAATTTYILPVSDGSGGQVLSTDGVGNLSWINGTSQWVNSGADIMYTLGDVIVSNRIFSGGDVILDPNRYLSFGSIGSGGYGIRDNGGVMEYKDSSGSWTPFSSLSSGTSGLPASYFHLNSFNGSDFFGLQSGYNNTGSQNTSMGDYSMKQNTSGSYNSAFGVSALNANTTGNGNVAVGQAALVLSNGNYNVGLGMGVMGQKGSGDYNVAVGVNTLGFNNTGSNNSALGSGAGAGNNGSNNVFLGYNAGSNEVGSNKLYIANSNTSNPLIYGDFSTVRVGIGTGAPGFMLTMGTGGGYYNQGTGAWINGSDRNYKTNILDLENYGLATIAKLRPVSFTVKQSGIQQIGFIAQEVKEIIPELVSGEDGHMGLNYAGLTPVLVKGLQEQEEQISNFQLQISKLESQLNLLATSYKLPATSSSITLSLLDQLANNGALDIKSDVNFYGHIYASGDTIGRATIKTGQNFVHINFTNPYKSTPIVTITANNAYLGLAMGVKNETTSGFDIVIAPAQNEDIEFSWHAFGLLQINTDQKQINTDTAGQINTDITPTPSPTGGPTQNPTPITNVEEGLKPSPTGSGVQENQPKPSPTIESFITPSPTLPSDGGPRPEITPPPAGGTTPSPLVSPSPEENLNN